jgi:ubiquinone biosynthesis monooxygenase Coq7
VCAQALYQGQALTARTAAARETLERAAREETEHLAWTAQRIGELGGRVSVLNPFFYAGSFAIGALSGLLGDKWNMGFLAETERQVEGHLDGHLDELPAQDEKSRAILAQMKEDEARHADTALAHGAAELPEPVKQAMRISSRLMTVSTYRV